MITEVLITVDTEFSIAGAFKNLVKFPPLGKSSVEGLVGNRECGLGFVLDALKKYDINATFFVEAINTRYFGQNEMGDIARRIRTAGQDVQLHVHPVWAVFNGGCYQESVTFPRNDSLLGRNRDQVARILEIGMEVFHDWGVGKPVAIRTGSLMVSDSLYPTFAQFGLQISSSVGTGIFMPEASHLQLDSGKKTIHGVSELPVTTFRDLPLLDTGHRKTLQITSCSWPEIRAVLLRANSLGIRRINLLTHSFEFFKRRDFRHSKITRNRVNQTRFLKLCRFLAENGDKFRSTSFSRSASQWIEEPDVIDPVIYSPGDIHAGIRKLHNGINDALWAY